MVVLVSQFSTLGAVDSRRTVHSGKPGLWRPCLKKDSLYFLKQSVMRSEGISLLPGEQNEGVAASFLVFHCCTCDLMLTLCLDSSRSLVLGRRRRGGDRWGLYCLGEICTICRLHCTFLAQGKTTMSFYLLPVYISVLFESISTFLLVSTLHGRTPQKAALAVLLG